MRESTSDKLQQIYQYIADYITENNYPPTVREIGKKFDIKSTATVYYYLDKLRVSGKIVQMPNKNRAMAITEKSNAAGTNAVFPAPLLGNISAGKGIFATENFEEFVPVPKNIYGDENLFVLRVQGDSMIRAGISDGDFVIVRKQETAEIGEIVVALWENTATVKRLSGFSPLVLHPENDTMSDIVIENGNSPSIVGKVVGCMKKF